MKGFNRNKKKPNIVSKLFSKKPAKENRNWDNTHRKKVHEKEKNKS